MTWNLVEVKKGIWTLDEKSLKEYRERLNRRCKCSSKVTNPNLKKMYLKFSGQLKKHHIVQEINLGDFS